jgi:hypothetical protein
MADETPRDPAGKEASKSREAGRPARATNRAAKARAKMPDLDTRNERMMGPRKPMGPPLLESSAAAKSKRAVSRSRSKPTDPESPSTSATRAPGRKRAARGKRGATARNARKRRS